MSYLDECLRRKKEREDKAKSFSDDFLRLRDIQRRIEIPTDLDMRRAEALLKKLTQDDLDMLWTWDGNPRTTILKIMHGEAQRYITPHKYLNVLSISFNLKWDGNDYVEK